MEVILPSPSNTTDSDFASLLDKNDCICAAAFCRLNERLVRLAHRRAPELPPDVAEDVVMEMFVLIKEHGAKFNPNRGSARAFITATLLPEAIRRVRAENVPPGAMKRSRKPGAPKWAPPALPLDDALDAPLLGHGSHESMEAICDLNVIWARTSPVFRILIGGLAEGLNQAEIASEMDVNRFKIARMMTELQRQFADAA
jgi:DNA-directed RNA polymerase specialized sigma24 family protein